MSINPCVSVFMLTYNQESYIAQAIEGVIMQKTEYTFELVIGEDNSTDSTREICIEYAKNYPEKIKLILNKENLGLAENYLKTYSACKGKFVAICDGDDYWIDESKLQKQVSFLQENSDFRMVFTNIFYLYPSGEKVLKNIRRIKEVLNFEDIIYDNQIPSVTSVFIREDLPENMRSWMTTLPYGDWPTYLFIMRNGGYIKYLEEPTAVYRKEIGTSNKLKLKRYIQGEINLFILQNIRTTPAFSMRKEIIEKAIKKFKMGLMGSYNKEKSFFKSFLYFCNLIISYGRPYYIMKIYLYSLGRTFFPSPNSR